MATNRSQRSRNRTTRSGITDRDYLYFSHGTFFEAEDYEDDKSPAQIRKFWLEHKHEIMERYDSEMRALGRKADRPWYYWEHDMTEGQRPIPKPVGAYDSQRVWNHQKMEFEWCETNYEYLERLDLLQEWEKTK